MLNLKLCKLSEIIAEQLELIKLFEFVKTLTQQSVNKFDVLLEFSILVRLWLKLNIILLPYDSMDQLKNEAYAVVKWEMKYFCGALTETCHN